MTDIEALSLATRLGGLFSARDDTVKAYAVALKGYAWRWMEEAITRAQHECDRLPSVKALIAIYRRAEAEDLATLHDGAGIPCHFCREEGGWRLPGYPTLYPPRPADAPYLPSSRYRTDDGKDLGPAWGHPPACSAHAAIVGRAKGDGGWIPPRVQESMHSILEIQAATWARQDAAVARGLAFASRPLPPASGAA